MRSIFVKSSLVKGDATSAAGGMIAAGYLENWIRADTPGYEAMLRSVVYATKSLVLTPRVGRMSIGQP